MKHFAKWLLLVVLVLACLVAVAITFTISWRPFFGPKARPLTARTFERTPQRLERGRYIATALSGCSCCHSPHDWSAPALLTSLEKRVPAKFFLTPISPAELSRPTSLPIPKPAPAAGLTINSRAPSVKALATTTAPFFR